jgi:hypothetical protein
MRKRVSAAVVLAAAATVLVTAGAGTGSATTSRVDLRDAAAVDSYLRSIGIDPATVVRQTGLLNYAGPNCPGAGWNCTTSSRVLQLAQPGGSNVAELSSSSSNDDCDVFQDGAHNKAHCKMRSTSDSASQEAFIEQEGERNQAIVDFDIQSRGGPNQDAIQTAEILQSATEKNDAHVKENVNQSTSAGLSQSQEAHQVAIVEQEVTGSENYAHVHQSQDQRESGIATDQEQNTQPSPVADCAFDSPTKEEPNACAYIAQSTPLDGDGATHKSHLHQSINQDQSTKDASANQLQGNELGGIEGEIDPTNPPGLGTSDKHAHQDHRQRQSGPDGVTQEQVIDPDCCGFGTTVGGERNTDDINQTAIQSASEDYALQNLLIRGATNHVAEEESLLSVLNSNGPTGDRCKITHHAANNNDSTHVTFDESCNIIVETTCFNGGESEVEGCFSEDVTPCEVCFSLPTIFPSAPTLGLAIQPANLGEPAGFSDPLLSGLLGS